MSILESLGWTSALDFHFLELASSELVAGRVLRAERDRAQVRTADDQVAWASWPQNLGHHNDSEAAPPVTGDFCAVHATQGGSRIACILPRRGVLTRGRAGGRRQKQLIAAHIDVAFIVNGLDSDFSPRRTERFLALALQGGIKPVVLLNKADLCDGVEQRVRQIEEVASGRSVHALSAKLSEGVEVVREHLQKNLTGVFVGSSGVGKSTLLNTLAEHELMPTRQIRDKDDRGRHTTTHRELFVLDGGGILIDTPGIREVGMLGVADSIAEVFDEISAAAVRCRFNDCTHRDEPGCAVLLAAESGEIAKERIASFHKLVSESETARRRETVHEQRHLEKQTYGRYRKQVAQLHPKYRK